MSRPEPPQNARAGEALTVSGKFFATLLILLAGVYLVQCASPLRLNTDAVTFLAMAASAADGQGFLDYGKPSHFPRGYPAIVAAMNKTGTAAAFTLVLLNCVFVGCGLAAAWGIMRCIFGFEKNAAFLVCVISLLSFVLIKHMTLALSDVPYFGVSMACLYFAAHYQQQAAGGKKTGLIITAIVLAFMAISIRLVGVALIPAVGWALIPKEWVQRMFAAGLQHKRRILLIAVPLLVVIGIASSVVLSHVLYIREAFDVYINGHGMHMIATLSGFRLEEFGELLLNMPLSKLPHAMAAVALFIGLFVLGMLVFALWRRRAEWGCIEFYLVFYCCILFVWPYKDTRFWLPVFPLFAILIANALRETRFKSLRGGAICAYLFLFSCAGLASLAYSTRLTFAGERFADLYGDEQTKAIYRQYAGLPADSTLVNDEWLYVLRRYQPQKGARKE